MNYFFSSVNHILFSCYGSTLSILQNDLFCNIKGFLHIQDKRVEEFGINDLAQTCKGPVCCMLIDPLPPILLAVCEEALVTTLR